MSLSDIEKQLGLEGPVGHPPVEKWSPPLSGDMDMVIRKDGTWVHEGDPIKREKLVRLFASILKKEGGDYFLVTPVEKWRIQVEDRPLLVQLIDKRGDQLQLVTNGGDSLIVGDDHPLKASELDGVMVPEVRVRNNLWARFSRNAYYQISELATEQSDGSFAIQSGGRAFVVG
ncbi:MAG: hypothetical protein CMI03_04460 [Oceanospirillaceae bacterium]|uniref:DUF1285 domain-containing protein n=2 Tax=unclassified Thalassolituus TaxID=2624967 RepID=UPI000C3EE129|nr:DUF1285 domain-containing protein [Thalassolituus sp. UBA1505]MAS25471.1 hypothetical protein [Oceanospirillaceae bacterium]MBS51988.1 hypothetical protein [Oceanospirillaceae bacterium]|tara:strand:+ start:46 stop:564 length:519 start_codon:yes stop_codon:yes gene_type:complete